ncbi:helix-turn-helix domain-containing protein [Latilactobacillus sakei]|uniref:AraC family transcriptional regulator n=1 Tax=Latilactobacillus sakei TaxID=1599 RepID=A0AAF0GSM3_LATSK|nr:AraC family transcriptional regulator [Latilactobacillus sakei]WGI18851.1 AraC family transcriptional regulator [Latilactobacillus sakei]
MLEKILELFSENSNTSIYYYDLTKERWLVEYVNNRCVLINKTQLLKYSRKITEPRIYTSPDNQLYLAIIQHRQDNKHLGDCIVLWEPQLTAVLSNQQTPFEIFSNKITFLNFILNKTELKTPTVHSLGECHFILRIDKDPIPFSEPNSDNIAHAEQNLQVENHLLHLITTGNEKMLSDFLTKFKTNPCAIKLFQGPVQDRRDVLVAALVLATRATISGGIEPSVAEAFKQRVMTVLDRSVETFAAFDILKSILLEAVRLVEQTKRLGNNSLVNRARFLIQSNLEKNWTIDEISNQLGISARYLSKLFKGNLGITVHEYIQQVRLEEAKYKLIYSNKNIACISIELGFADSSHFSRFFKATTQYSPSTFRKKFRT